MIIKTLEIKDVANKILAAVDSNELSEVTETLQLKVCDNTLYVSVTNREYYAEVKLEVGAGFDGFHAAINANLFLKLISQITTENIDLNIKDTYMEVVGNGTYKLPLIFDGENVMELPKIEITNVTTQMDVDAENLNSILQYNSKQLNVGTISKPIQKLYYLDDKGAVTFTTGACVNSFALEKPISILLNNRLVKLFKLFKTGKVKLTLGYDAISDDIIQTKVKFESNDIILTAILSCDDTMLKSFPVNVVRGRAENLYPYSINLNKDAFLQTINRLLLFSSGFGAKEIIKPYATFNFSKDKVTVWDVRKENCEDINYVSSDSKIMDTYEAIFDLTDLKATLESCSEQYLTMNFGDNAAMVIKRGNIANVVPQCRLG